MINYRATFWLRFSLIIVLFCCLIFVNGCHQTSPSGQQPTAEAGVLDLNDWNFEQQGMVKLNGEWEFYWHQLLTPADFQNPEKPELTDYRQVPGLWNKQKDKNLPGYGYATYRLIINLDSGESLKFIKFKNISSSYKLWVNGEFKAYNGVVAKTEKKQKPQRREVVVAFPKQAEKVELIMQISNFFYLDGGFKTDWKNIQLGTKEQINGQVKRELTFNIFVCGSLLIMAFYHIAHHFIASKYSSSLYFGLLCLMVAVRNLFLSNAFFVVFPVNFPFWLRVKVEFCAAYAGMGLLATYIYELFTEEADQKIIRFFQIFLSLLSLIVILFPMKIYTWTKYPGQMTIAGLTLYLFIVVCKVAWRKRDRSAIVLLIGFFFLLMTAINDVLLLNQVINTVYLVHYGMFVFILSHSTVMIFKFNETVRKFELEQQKRTIAEKLRQVTNVLISRNFEEVLNRLLVRLEEMIAYNWAVVLLKEENLLRPKAAQGDIDLNKLEQLEIKIDNSLFFRRVLSDFTPYIAEQTNENFMLADWGVTEEADSLVAIPLMFQQEIEGVLLVGCEQGDITNDRVKDIVTAFAGQAAIAIKNARLFSQIRELANYDELTGLYNRRTFFRLAQEKIKQAQDKESSLAVIMLDIDNFKQFNDQYGHAAGDKVLTEVAKKCKEIVRNSDIVGRYGGEEFVVLLPQADLSCAQRIAERLRKSIAELTVNLDAELQVSVTVSVGAAEFTAGMTLNQVLNNADDALYKAKESGRNCVKIYSQSTQNFN